MSKPRSGIPTPGRSSSGSGIPGRSRSSSSSGPGFTFSQSSIDADYMNQAFAEAIKANDPASHVGRGAIARVSDVSSNGGLSPKGNGSGRSSARPSSVASSSASSSSLATSSSFNSSVSSSSIARAKTPTSARPPSRSSDVFARSSSRAGRVFDVGDGVRIESLGFEGVLRYVGEIDGKPGLWAGVELSGGFAGKGKNDGSVAGKQYFVCPPKCGVFVATTKLSPPTVGPGARPSSVSSQSSLQGGRTTPSFGSSYNGRITPLSFSTSTSTRGGRIGMGARTPSIPMGGRITPSGRVTPASNSVSTGPETPAARAARLRAAAKGPSNKTNAGVTPAKAKSQGSAAPEVPVPVPGVTPGTRASKYAGMTAKQLSLNKSYSSPPHPSNSSSSTSLGTLSPLTTTTNIHAQSGLPSPSRRSASATTGSGIPGSPFSTPKPRLTSGIGGPPGSTPRPRLPSAIAMPPPASPSRIGIAASPRRENGAEVISSDDLQARTKALQDRIAGLTGTSVSPPSSSSSPPLPVPAIPSSPKRPQSRTSRPSSVASTRSTRSTTPGFGRASIGAGAAAVKSGRASVDPDRTYLMEQLQSRVDALEYENERLRGRVESSEKERDNAVAGSLGGENGDAALKETIQRLQDELKEARETSSAPAADVSESTAASEEVEARLKQSEARVKEFTARLEDAQAKAVSSQVHSSEIETQLASVQTQLTSVEEAKASLELQLGEKVNELEEAQKTLVEQRREADNAKEALESKTKELELVEAKLRRVTVDFEEERRDLGELVDELRQAGQETIALYEEKLRVADVQRYELEDRIAELKIDAPGSRTISHGHSPSSASSTTAASTTTSPFSSPNSKSHLNNDQLQTTSEIEHATLLDQVAHLQRKVSTLEDLIEDSRMQYEKEEGALQTRLTRMREREESFKKEITELKREINEVGKDRDKARNRVEEVEEALRESGVALEEARAEVEGLRGELADVNGLAASTSSASGELQSKMTQAQMKWEVEKEQFLEQIESMQRLMDDQKSEVDSLRKKANVNGVQSGKPEKERSDKEKELKSAKEEITGLKHIVQELQKEAVAQGQQNKMLESENQLLISEMEQLRQEVKILEDNLDQSILREEENLNIDEGTTGSDLDTMKKALKEQRLRSDVEIEQLRKKLADVEMKHARTTHDLNKEISELEALVESKIYREDELEQEIERLKDKIARQQRKASKSSTGPAEVISLDRQLSPTPSHRSKSSISSTHLPPDAQQEAEEDSSEPVCEICERPGHDIFNCDLLKEDGPLSASSSTSSAGHKSINGSNVDLWCEDCETHGHLAENCPNSLDVF